MRSMGFHVDQIKKCLKEEISVHEGNLYTKSIYFLRLLLLWFIYDTLYVVFALYYI